MTAVLLLAALAGPPAGPLPPGAVDRLGSPALRHTSPVAAVAFSPDGKRLASGSNTNNGGTDPRVKVWDAATGAEVWSARHDSTCVAWSADGRRLASAGRDGTVKVWAVASGREVFTSQTPGGWAVGVAVSPDGKWVASIHGNRRAVRLWDAATGALVRELSPAAAGVKLASSDLAVVAFHPDGKSVAAGVPGLGLVFWDVATGAEGRTIPGVYTAHGWLEHRGITFAGPNALVAVCQPEGVTLFDPAADNPVWHTGGYRPAGVALSADGSRLAVVRNNELILLAVPADRELRTFATPGRSHGPFALSPDGRLLARADGNMVVVWETATGRRLHTDGGLDGYVGLVGFGPAGEVYAHDAAGLRVWDIGPGGKRRGELMRGCRNVVALSPDGRTAVIGGYLPYPSDRPRLVDIATGDEQAVLETPEREGVLTAVFHPDGRRLITRDLSGRAVTVWDAVTGKKLRTFGPHHDPAYSLALSPDGKRLITASQVPMMLYRSGPPPGYKSDAGVREWDVDTGAELRRLPGQASQVVYSPAGDLLAVVGTGLPAAANVRLLNSAGAEVRPLQTPKYYVPNRIAFAPDGRTLVMVGRDKAVRLWDVSTGTERRRFDGHTGEVYGLAVSADGKRLVTSGGDGLAYVWDVYAPDRPPPADLAPAVKGLADPDAAAAFRAVRELVAAGDRAVPLVAGVGPADSWGPRAVEVLEAVGSPAARRALATLAGGDPAARLTREAKAAGDRLDRRAVPRWTPPVVEPPADAEKLLGGPPRVTARLNARAVLGADRGRLIPAANARAAVAYWWGHPLKVIDLPTGRERRSVPLPEPGWMIHDASLSPDGSRLAFSAGRDGASGSLYVWDVTAGRQMWAADGVMPSTVISMVWSPAGDRLAVAGNEPPAVRVWDAATGREHWRWSSPPRANEWLACSTDGRHLAAHRGGGRRVFDLTTGAEAGPGWNAPGQTVFARAFSGDGRSLLFDTRLSERASGKVRAALTGDHPEGGDVWYCAMSSDARTAVTADKHGLLLVWDLANDRPHPGLTAADWDALWQLLGGHDARLAYRAGWRLTAGGDASVAAVLERIPPVPADPTAHVAELVAALDAPTPAARQAATERLELLGPLAAPALRRAPGRPAGEWTDRVTHLLTLIDRPTPAGEVVRAVRAVEVLERMATPAARAALVRYAAGPPGHALTAEAGASLRRLGGG